MSFIKKVLCSLIFIAGLAGLLIVSSYIFIPKNNMKEFGMEQAVANGILGEKEQTVDVVILGDSESYSSISPLQIWKERGYTSYVCGSGGQSLDYSNTLLHRTFEKQTPKIVILETNAIYRKVSFNTLTLEKMSGYFSVFRYHNRWKSLSSNDFGGKVKFTWTDDNKGFSYRTRVNPSNKRNYMASTKHCAHITEINKQYVKKMKQFCDDNNATLVLLSIPSTVNWNYSRHNGIQALADNIGCEYIDLNLMNDKINIDWSQDTRDKGDHLNYYGAKKVTHYLSDYLSLNKSLTDHREDKKFTKWNQALKRYEDIVGDAS